MPFTTEKTNIQPHQVTPEVNTMRSQIIRFEVFSTKPAVVMNMVTRKVYPTILHFMLINKMNVNRNTADDDDKAGVQHSQLCFLIQFAFRIKNFL